VRSQATLLSFNLGASLWPLETAGQTSEANLEAQAVVDKIFPSAHTPHRSSEWLAAERTHETTHLSLCCTEFDRLVTFPVERGMVTAARIDNRKRGRIDLPERQRFVWHGICAFSRKPY